MMQSFDDAGKFGKKWMDNSLKSAAALSKGMQTISVEAADFSKKAFETGSATIEQLATAKSLDKALEIQSDYMKKAYEDFIAEATKMGDLYAEMAKEAYKPFEAAIARSK